jgi:flagellar protein FlbB
VKRFLVFCIVVAVFAGSMFLDRFRLGALNAGAESAVTPKTPAETVKGQESAQTGQQPLSASRAAREEKAIQDARRQQIAEKEAALAAKEQELKKLGAKLDSQVKALEDSKKRLDDSLKVQKKAQDEKQKKMIGFFKKMRPEQAGQLMDKLDEDKVISLLNQMDTKTIIKLVPFLKQPRVLKWINDNLKGV